MSLPLGHPARIAIMEYLLKVDACICRHSHKPYHRVLKNPKKKGSYFHSVNAASVGNPKDGNPKSYYAILTIDKSSNLSKKEGAQVEFVRVT